MMEHSGKMKLATLLTVFCLALTMAASCSKKQPSVKRNDEPIRETIDPNTTKTTVKTAEYDSPTRTENKTEYYIDVMPDPNATVYRSIDQLAADSDYVFLGRLKRIEPNDALRQWEIYEVVKPYKGTEAAAEIRLSAYKPGLLHSEYGKTPKRNIGNEYYIFAVMTCDLPTWPYPIISPVYGLAIFRFGGTRCHYLDCTSIHEIMPAVCEESFLNDPEGKILSCTKGLAAKRDLPHTEDRFDSLKDMLNASDLVVRVVFDNVEQHATLFFGHVSSIQSEYSTGQSIPVPDIIYLNQNVRTGGTYLIFLKAGDDGARYSLTAREGAIVSSADTEKWNAVMALLRDSVS